MGQRVWQRQASDGSVRLLTLHKRVDTHRIRWYRGREWH
jgi:hypothetical protein